jgi:hypothetical protein
MEFKKVIFIGFLIFFVSGCNENIPFEKGKWKKQVDGFYPYRDAMMESLLQSTEFKGKTLKQAFDILGKHDNWCDHNMYELKYQVLEEYGSDMDPVHTKYLVFELNSSDKLIDSNTVIINYRIDEWKK